MPMWCGSLVQNMSIFGYQLRNLLTFLSIATSIAGAKRATESKMYTASGSLCGRSAHWPTENSPGVQADCTVLL
jgi:hypothetical protein